MIQEKLGNTLLKVSKVGLGLSQLSNTTNKRLFRYKSKNDVLKVIRYAIKNQINFFDTSKTYGETEEIIGSLTKKEKNNIIISTKAGLNKIGERNFSTKDLEKQLDDSIKKLKVEKIDLFMINKPSYEDIKKNQLINFLEKLKNKGKIINSGIIIGNKKGIKRILKNKNLDCFSILFNLMNVEDYDLIQEAHFHGKGVIVRSPLNSGLLSGRYNLKNGFAKTDIRKKIINKEDFRNKLLKIDLLREKFKIDHNEILKYSLDFLIQNKIISTILVGCSNIKDLKTLRSIVYKNENKKNTKIKETIIFSKKISDKIKTKSQC